MSKKSFDEFLETIKGKKILVANRGIPARRICRSITDRCNAIAVMTATDVDKSCPSASAAKELLLLGSSPTAYLDIDDIIAKAKEENIIAIHPGWGFASEDSEFPRKCKEAGIVFIGSSSEAMNMLGNKVEARNLAKKLNIPVVPGSEGAVDIPEARKLIKEMGLPVMLKAEGGGGGRGIFAIHNEEELEDAFLKASTMAEAAFGNPRLFVEKYLQSVRHIEIQVIADKYGNVFAFDERDCSVQRNHQKLIEITPSPWAGMTEELRAQLKEYSCKLIKHVNYDSLATIEFLVTDTGVPYLIEINTRLQVEHGITECRYGIDLVETQIGIAFGMELPFTEENTKPQNHAVQVRINCEDPQNNFTPNAGRIMRYVSPGGLGIRLDSNISAGYDFPSNYDSAGALLISYGYSWEKICGTMSRALSEYVITGLKTTIPFYKHIFKNDEFLKARFDTNFIANNPSLLEYQSLELEADRLTRLIAEISARGYNPHIQLGEYRSMQTPRLPKSDIAIPRLSESTTKAEHLYPHGDRLAVLDFVRDTKKVHFTDTTCRDMTQSNTGNRFRLAEDKLLAPYLDKAQLFSIENGGGAHFHVNMLANMTYPFTEAKEWNAIAPNTNKQLLLRSTNGLGYTPQSRNVMEKTAEMICQHYDVIRCFDFLNDFDNMKPLTEIFLNHKHVLFEPALSLSVAEGFDVNHYLNVTKYILESIAKIMGLSVEKASKEIILGLKDMAGVCSSKFMRDLVTALRKEYPNLVLHYHRHYTDGLFVPSVGAAVSCGCHIVDAALGSGVRSYGQGDIQSTAAYIKDEYNIDNLLNMEAINQANFVLKQVMPYYDRYASPYFLGTDYNVVNHAMPGGATSSSQEGALKQGYIHLLPYMLEFLTATRKITRYHDVTPGSQITWNTAFLAITGAYKRGGEDEVRHLLAIIQEVSTKKEEDLSDDARLHRVYIYQDCNDAFRNLLLGKFGKLPLGFPDDWVYESAFGPGYKEAIKDRTTDSPLANLADVDIEKEIRTLRDELKRDPTDEEITLFLNHPADALKTFKFINTYGNPNCLPLDVWFEGLELDRELIFVDSNNKPHSMNIYSISPLRDDGTIWVRYTYNSEYHLHVVKITNPSSSASKGIELADNANPYHVAAPSSGDLWVMYVKVGDIVNVGDELFNISIMKQEKAVLAKTSGIVKRICKGANYKQTRSMVPVKEGELLVELAPVPRLCTNELCQKPLQDTMTYCPYCGMHVGIAE